jgi:hypothetical protein
LDRLRKLFVAMAWVPLVAGMVTQTTCYNPSFKDGLLCSVPEGLCPDGFSCDMTSGRCLRPDAAVDTGADDVNLCPNLTPVSGCTIQADLACDPVCRTGCCGQEKCTALNQPESAGGAAAKLGCSSLTAERILGDPCVVNGGQTPRRSDNCEAGLVCINANTPQCLKLCRSAADCPTDTKCETRFIDPSGSYKAKVCGLPNTGCDPVGDDLVCPPKQVCYLVKSTATGDTTICDIAFGAATTGACIDSRDCRPGYTCPTGGPGASNCWPVCDRTAPMCPLGSNCQTTGKRYDYCYPDIPPPSTP